MRFDTIHKLVAGFYLFSLAMLIAPCLSSASIYHLVTVIEMNFYWNSFNFSGLLEVRDSRLVAF